MSDYVKDHPSSYSESDVKFFKDWAKYGKRDRDLDELTYPRDPDYVPSRKKSPLTQEDIDALLPGSNSSDNYVSLDTIMDYHPRQIMAGAHRMPTKQVVYRPEHGVSASTADALEQRALKEFDKVRDATQYTILGKNKAFAEPIPNESTYYGGFIPNRKVSNAKPQVMQKPMSEMELEEFRKLNELYGDGGYPISQSPTKFD